MTFNFNLGAVTKHFPAESEVESPNLGEPIASRSDAASSRSAERPNALGQRVGLGGGEEVRRHPVGEDVRVGRLRREVDLTIGRGRHLGTALATPYEGLRITTVDDGAPLQLGMMSIE